MGSDSTPDTAREQAERLLAAHHGREPLLLANVWDAASARAVEAAGFGFVATSSRAIAQVLGVGDDDSSEPALIFDWLARIAGSVGVPVTADLEAGYRLPPDELVERLLDAGAVGCNLEDSDHHGGGVLVEVERQADYLAAVRAAANAAGVPVVVNARVDTFIRHVGEPGEQTDEAIRRGRHYLAAGADCVYPIAVSRREDVAALVAAIPGPLNFVARRAALSIGELAALGARRISLASGLYTLFADRLGAALHALREGVGLDEL